MTLIFIFEHILHSLIRNLAKASVNVNINATEGPKMF